MNVVINDNMNIATVQQLFNEIFPFLKIEFFEKENRVNTVLTKKRIHNSNKKLIEFKIPQIVETEICIHPNMTVTELEKELKKLYKIQTQVFRKSGNIWLETTITDGWTLKEQNNQGEMITAQITNK